MSSIPDSYLTIAKPAEGLYKDKGSKFISWAYPVKDLQETPDSTSKSSN
jgi:hypothetical protein